MSHVVPSCLGDSGVGHWEGTPFRGSLPVPHYTPASGTCLSGVLSRKEFVKGALAGFGSFRGAMTCG